MITEKVQFVGAVVAGTVHIDQIRYNSKILFDCFLIVHIYNFTSSIFLNFEDKVLLLGG